VFKKDIILGEEETCSSVLKQTPFSVSSKELPDNGFYCDVPTASFVPSPQKMQKPFASIATHCDGALFTTSF
jgi:hypothetical protein